MSHVDLTLTRKVNKNRDMMATKGRIVTGRQTTAHLWRVCHMGFTSVTSYGASSVHRTHLRKKGLIQLTRASNSYQSLTSGHDLWPSSSITAEMLHPFPYINDRLDLQPFRHLFQTSINSWPVSMSIFTCPCALSSSHFVILSFCHF